MGSVVREPQVKGGLLLARLGYLRNQGGAALQERVLGQLAPADAAMLRRPILPLSWYPWELHLRVDDAIASLVSSPAHRADVLVQIGRASAEAILGGSHPQYIKRGAPRFFLEVVPRLYRVHHTVGRREYQPLAENAGVVRTYGVEHLVTSDDCWTILGWLQRGLELSAADAALVTETCCRATGAPYCEYRCDWCGSATI